MSESKLPPGTRLPTLKEWKQAKRTQPHSAVLQVINDEGDTENIWFDKDSEAPTA